MLPKSNSQYLDIALNAAKIAGQFLKEKFILNKNEFLEKSGEQGIVTKADKTSEKIIIELLSKTKIAILSEEAEENDLLEFLRTKEKFWVIDPLDGTTNFVSGLPLFSVSIALVENGETTLGVIYNPMQNELLYAVKGEGAFIEDRRIFMERENNLPRPVLFINSGYDQVSKAFANKQLEIFCADFSVRRLGATVPELSYVARGAACGFVCSGDKVWDYAAGVLICAEAGAVVSDWKGGYWKLEQSYMIVSNKSIHPKLVQGLSGLEIK